MKNNVMSFFNSCDQKQQEWLCKFAEKVDPSFRKNFDLYREFNLFEKDVINSLDIVIDSRNIAFFGKDFVGEFPPYLLSLITSIKDFEQNNYFVPWGKKK